jgi:hypothetical protein
MPFLRSPVALITDGTGATVLMPGTGAASYKGTLLFQWLFGVLLASVHLASIEGAAPVFTQSEWRGNISEDAHIGTSVLRIEATDGDGDSLDYTIWGGQNHNHFSLGFSNGVLSTAVSLDRERIQSYTLTVSASDFMSFPQTTVSITVLDVNDNPPSCTHATVMVPLSESARIGTYVTQINCTDADAGLNGQLHYRIVSGDAFHVFAIQNSSGIMETSKKLDYESTTSYELIITVSDKGEPVSLRTNVTVLIPVRAVNEYAPRFSNSTYSANVVAESPPATIVLRVSADDSDKGPDGLLTYRMVANTSNHFTVNASSGDIVLSNFVYYDCFEPENNVFSLTIEVIDRGHPAKSMSMNITVAVVPRNNHRPTCSPGAYVIPVPESVDPGTAILHVICSDLDGSPLKYKIADSTASNVFNMTESGELVTSTALDYEKQTSYNFVIAAKESCVSDSRSATALVRVQVTGVNEHSPTFAESTYNVSVREDARVSSVLLHFNATDEDDGLDGEVYYSIKHPARSTGFLVDRISGMLILARSLDRETKNVHLLIIEANDRGLASNRKSTSAVVNVTVEDVNDNAPVCSPSVVVATVDEAVHMGTTVANLSCLDLDADVNGQLSYQISGARDTNAFTVTSWGEIRTNASLARPHLPNFLSFDVIVSDNGYPRLAVNTSVVVQLTRKQRHIKPPEFRSLRYYSFLSENSTIGTTAITVTANSPQNASVWYSVITSDAGATLAVDPVTGDIVLTGTLDREVKDSYTVTVGASVRNTQRQELRTTAIATVNIGVSDVNDNAPSCAELLLTASISETAPPFTSIARLQCSDIDKNENGYVTFQIVEPTNQLPIILTIDGEFRTNATLDYESVQSYFFIVTVQDNGTPPKRVNVSAKILVEPTNEFSPLFLYESFNVSIPEDTFIGTVITEVQANDLDHGKDGQVTYTITGKGSIPFVIEKASGRVLLTANLDRELVQSYSMTVTARDSGTEVKSTSISLLVMVADTNDNSPSCYPQTVVVSLSTDTDNGTAIAGLNCDDPDQNNNSRLSYNITSQVPVPFTIDSSGHIYVTALGLQRQPEVFLFPVTVTDGGLRARSTTVQVIAVMPKIDTKEILDPTYDRLVVFLVLSESVTVGKVLVRLNCTVPAGSPKYNITEGDDAHQFEIGVLGDLTVAKPVDYETKKQYRITVVCTSSLYSFRFASSFVDIQVTDVNEFSPVFTQKTMTVTVSESQDVGSLVTTVRASDRDGNGKLEYSIMNVTPTNHPFILDPTSGRIALLRKLDRELVDRYEINIAASDSLHKGYTSLRIEVLDTNDNPPSCHPLVHLIVLNGTERPKSVVGKLDCTDKDTGFNSKLKYQLIGSGSHLLEINSTNGQLKLSQDLTDLRLPNDVMLKTLISDEGRPFPLNETVKVVVRLLQTNRYPPEFMTPRLRLFKVNESERLGTRIGEITARDRDKTDTAIEYRLVASDRTPFFLDRWTGFVYLTDILDRENVDSYLLTVEVTDAGYPTSKTSTASFAMTVLDINDNPPVCTPTVYGSILDAFAPPDTVLTKLNCSDADLGQNAALQYEIREDVSSDRTFRINSTGHVTLQSRPGLISEPRLQQLPVIVRDRGSVSLSTTVIVVVRIVAETTDQLDTLRTMKPIVGPTGKDDSEWMANSVAVELLDFDRKRWVSGGRSKAKALFSLGATVYCNAYPSDCSVIKPLSDRYKPVLSVYTSKYSSAVLFLQRQQTRAI